MRWSWSFLFIFVWAIGHDVSRFLGRCMGSPRGRLLSPTSCCKLPGFTKQSDTSLSTQASRHFSLSPFFSLSLSHSLLLSFYCRLPVPNSSPFPSLCVGGGGIFSFLLYCMSAQELASLGGKIPGFVRRCWSGRILISKWNKRGDLTVETGPM